MEQITEQEERARGEAIIQLLGLRPKGEFQNDNRTLYNTKVGTKTALGLYRTMVRIVVDGDTEFVKR